MSDSQTLKIGLEAVGIQNNQHLKNSLISCDDPLKAISDFQDENSILLPTLKPALNLLDLHNIKRLDFHVSIAEELKDQLTKRVEELAASIHSANSSKEHQSNSVITAAEEDQRKLEELLDKSFPLINLPRLTQLILLIMKSIPKIKEVYLNYLKENEHLYNMTSIEVKRQIWSVHIDLFVRELQPLFDKFIQYYDDMLTNFEISVTSTTVLNLTNIDSAIIRENLLLNSTAYSQILKTNKRQTTSVNDIIKLIGTNHKLYQYSINTLMSLYNKNQNWLYSTLRSQLVIKLNETYHHDVSNPILMSGDSHNENVLKFASIINLCLKEKKIDTKRAKELETIMESKKFDKIISEIAFILADPFVIDMLARNAMSFLNRCVQNELLPRNCTELIFVLRLLSMGLFAWDIISGLTNKEPKIDSILITEYLPNLAYFITDYYEKLYDDSLEALSNPAESTTQSLLASPTNILGTPSTSAIGASSISSLTKSSPPILLKISTRKLEIVSSIKLTIVENEVCAILFFYLVVVCFEVNDWVNLRVLLPAVRYPEKNSNLLEKWFLYLFFNMLGEKSVIEQFKHDWFVTLIFDEYLLPLMQQKDSQSSTSNSTNVLYDQIFKLIDKIYPSYLTSISFSRLIEFIKPKKSHSSSFHIMYLKLKAKLEKIDPSSHSLMEKESL